MRENSTLNTLYQLKKEIEKSNNTYLVSQIDHAILKTYKSQLTFSFIGHYSAGKSSLINHLLSEEILPSSPIPTTSNTVAIEVSEDSLVRAFLNQYEYFVIKNYDELKKYNATDIDISSIEIKVKNDNFNHKTVFQDTPGMDSNTESHREYTNRFLFNSDVIFFTVEYNHVESAENLNFLKTIQSLNIPFVLLINQIDKHDDNELSINEFLNRVKHTLDIWKINPERILMTTIFDSPYNQINKLKSYIHTIEKDKENYLSRYRTRMIHNIEKKQKEYIEGEIEKRNNTSEISVKEVKERLQHVEEKINTTSMNDIIQSGKIESFLNSEVKSIIENSYLFPHEVKNAIEHYLKVETGEVEASGFFNKKKKQQELEKDAHKNVLNELQTVMNTQVVTQINSLFQRTNLSGEPFKYSFNIELLNESHMNQVTHTFLLNYLDRLRKRIEKDVIQNVFIHYETLTLNASVKNDNLEQLNDEKNALLETEQLLKLFNAIKTNQYRHFHVHMDKEIERLKLQTKVEVPEFKAKQQTHKPHQFNIQETNYNMDSFHNIIHILESYPHVSQWTNVIREKVSRIKSDTMNLSVFGGFSAGKTTFINALMGDHYLKTSPNPTTATITEIKHSGEAYVTLKKEEALIDTLKVISNENYHSVRNYIPWIKKNYKNVSEVYQPFLTAILKKYDEYAPYLNQEINLSTTDIIQKIANDIDATFIHKAYISIKTPFTKQFNIVDSPGINSMNERHTNETHEIIRESDMVIYVSYYNHVFSRPDEDFLKYIQSIKGQQFPFVFVINAIDLVKKKSDLNQVIQYMESALNQLNINYKIYPLSSKLALTHFDEGFNIAKKEIAEIATINKTALQVESLKELIQQLKLTIKSDIERFKNHETETARIKSARENALEEVKMLNTTQFKSRLKQEVDVIMTHLTKQLELKLYDLLKVKVSQSDFKDKKYFTNHLNYMNKEIAHTLNLATQTTFNYIYEIADHNVQLKLQDVNACLTRTNIPSNLEFQTCVPNTVRVSFDKNILSQYEKNLAQHRRSNHEFKSLLLDLSKSLVRSLNITQLEKDLFRDIDAYLNDVQCTIEPSKEIVLKHLSEPLKKIDMNTHEDNVKLLEQLKGVQ